jgi:hypothetical protein
MFVLSAIYILIKDRSLESNASYQTHPSATFILHGIGRYVDQLFNLAPESFGAWKVIAAVVVLLRIAVAMRNRAVAFGTLFFVIAVLPVSMIATRAGYAAYIAWPGLTLAIGVMLVSARSALLRLTHKENLEVPGMVAVFLAVAVVWVACFSSTRKTLMSLALWEQERRVAFLTGLKRNIPEFPPNARILMLNDPWGPDWAPMFLTTLLYHDGSIWMDRVKSGDATLTGDRQSYDLLIDYKLPKLGTTPSRIFGVRKSWEIHWLAFGDGEFDITSPDPSRAPRDIAFSPLAVRTGRPVTVTVPGLANVRIDAIFRIVSGDKSEVHNAEGWCTLDAQGSCRIPAPYGGKQAALSVDWVRPAKGRWIFTSGVLTLVE